MQKRKGRGATFELEILSIFSELCVSVSEASDIVILINTAPFLSFRNS